MTLVSLRVPNFFDQLRRRHALGVWNKLQNAHREGNIVPPMDGLGRVHVVPSRDDVDRMLIDERASDWARAVEYNTVDVATSGDDRGALLHVHEGRSLVTGHELVATHAHDQDVAPLFACLQQRDVSVVEQVADHVCVHGHHHYVRWDAHF
jgi:hypothetical protein